LNKQLTLESDYIHPIIKIVVGWKVLVCKEEEKKKKKEVVLSFLLICPLTQPLDKHKDFFSLTLLSFLFFLRRNRRWWW
jgi:hypothetical protein